METTAAFAALMPQWLRHPDGYDVVSAGRSEVEYREGGRSVLVSVDPEGGAIDQRPEAARVLSAGAERPMTSEEAARVLPRVAAGLEALYDETVGGSSDLTPVVSRSQLSSLTEAALLQVGELSRSSATPSTIGDLQRELTELRDAVEADELPPVGARHLGAFAAAEAHLPLGSPNSLAVARLRHAYANGFDPDADDQYLLSYTPDEVRVMDDLLGEREVGTAVAELERLGNAWYERGMSELVGRGAVRLDEDGDLFLCEPHRTLFETMHTAELSLTVECRAGQDVNVTRFHVGGPVTVEELAPHEAGARLSVLDSEGVLSRTVGLLGLVGRDADIDATEPIEVDRRSLERALQGRGKGHLGDVFQDAEVTMCRVIVGFATEDGYASTGLAWIDGSEAGLWMVEPVDTEAYERGDEPDRYRVHHVSAADLVEQLVQLLPA